ncbi:MAG: ComF family protein [Candidatus Cloacimonetes bacterium]|nr:ComF family protein [Candidatus Cloacimonadota bacterium]
MNITFPAIIRSFISDSTKCIGQLNLLYPPVCQNCGNRIDKAQDWLCSDCLNKLEELETGLCPECGHKLVKGECFECGRPDEPWTEAEAVFGYHDSLRALIHSLKYKDKRKIAEYLATRAEHWLDKHRVFTDAEVILPVPLHSVRQRERGFNQSALLAEKIALKTGWEYYPHALKRVRATQKQSMVRTEQRSVNVKGAFKVVKPEKITGKNVVVLDDIYTSGSTMREVCAAVNECNPNRLYVFTIGKVC